MALLAGTLARNDPFLESLIASPAWVRAQIERSLDDADCLDRYRDATGGAVIARGANLGTAFEIAPKIRELSGIPFEPLPPPDLLHGPIAAFDAGRPVIVVAPSGRTLESVRASVGKLRERGAAVLAISDDPGVLAAADTALPLALTAPEWLTPLLTVIPGQIAAVRLATLRGGDVDDPHGLTKVTLTR